MMNERTPILPLGRRVKERIVRNRAVGGILPARHQQQKQQQTTTTTTIAEEEEDDDDDFVGSSSSSQVSGMTTAIMTMDKDHAHHHPRSKFPSLDFDRVVNSYSIQATKRRLAKRRGHAMRTTGCNRANQQTTTTTSHYNKKKHHVAGSTFWSRPYGKQVVTWILTCTVGLLCGLTAVLILHCVELIVRLRIVCLNRALQQLLLWSSSNGDSSSSSSSSLSLLTTFITKHGYTGLFTVFCAYNLLLAMTSSLLCLWCAPKAIGSGIPEAKAYLNGVAVPSFADANTFVVKIVGTILSVSSGLIVGPEGPLVHVGAIIGQGLTKSTRLDVALRRFQANFPTMARIVGCASIDALGDELQNGKHDPDVEKRDRAIHGLQYGLRMTGSDDADDEGKGPESMLLAKNDHGDSSSAGSCCCPSRTTFVSQFVSVLSRFRNDTDRRDFISIGVAVAFAACFGAPVGGLLYSIEEASSFYTIELMFRTLVATAFGTLVIAVYHGDLTKFSVLSLGDQLEEHRELTTGAYYVLPICILLGAMGGILGALFNFCYRRINEWRQRIYDRMLNSGGGWVNAFKLWQVFAVSVITSTVSFFLPLLLPSSWTCRPHINQEANSSSESDLSYFKQFTCDEGHVNAFAIFLLGSRDEALNDILTDPGKFGAKTLLLCSATCFFLLVVTFGTALPMGLFMPTLLAGSSFGGAIGLLAQEHLVAGISPSNMALVGATAMLAGVQRTTVSLCVIMMEASGQTKVLIPLIIAVVVARYVSDRFNEGFYHIVMEMKGYPFLEHHVKTAFDLFRVSEIMSSPVVVVHEIETAGQLEKLLDSTNVGGFPVIKETTEEYVGFIRRDQVVALLECSVFMEEVKQDISHSALITNVLKDAHHKNFHRVLLRDDDIYTGPTSKHTARTSRMTTNVDWLQDNVMRTVEGDHVMVGADDILPMRQSILSVGSTSVDLSEDGALIVNLAPGDAHKHVDISAAMNRGAYTVVENTPLSKAYKLFAGLGLRTLPVLGDGGKVVGILSRSNFQPDFMSERTGMDLHY